MVDRRSVPAAIIPTSVATGTPTCPNKATITRSHDARRGAMVRHQIDVDADAKERLVGARLGLTLEVDRHHQDQTGLSAVQELPIAQRYRLVSYLACSA